MGKQTTMKAYTYAQKRHCKNNTNESFRRAIATDRASVLLGSGQGRAAFRGGLGQAGDDYCTQ